MPNAERTRVAIVINAPAPYRNPVFEQMALDPTIDLHVIFCSALEPIRGWDIASSEFAHEYLKERYVLRNQTVIHVNPEVWGALRRFDPDVVITTGFNPTHLFAYLYCRLRRIRHVAWIDSTATSETTLSPLHRMVRRHIYPRSFAFIGASNGSTEHYRSYGIADDVIFKAVLCADNELFQSAPAVPKRYDFIFSGRFTDVKNPVFALKVVDAVSRRIGRPASIAIIGAGELDADMRAYADAKGLDADFLGFAKQAELPAHYAAARILLFPTTWEPWGIVANEACAAGVPVIVTPVAGVAGELVKHGVNGYVLPLEVELWADSAARLLSDAALYEEFSSASRRAVSDFTYTDAAHELVRAINCATQASRVGGRFARLRRPQRAAIRVVRRRFPDRSVQRDIQGTPLWMPWDHLLPDIVARNPAYGHNLLTVAEAVEDESEAAFTVIDVGANIGDSAAQIRATALSCHVVAIDGDDRYLPYLRRNLADDPNCHIVEALLSDSSAPRQARPVRSGGTTRFVDDSSAAESRIVTAEHIAASVRGLPPVRLIKSDTDGFDTRLVPALARAFIDVHPVLFFEYDPALSSLAGDDRSAGVFSSLTDLGYSSCVIWDNFGNRLGVLTASDAGASDAWFDTDQLDHRYNYWDVAMVHDDDPGLRDRIEALVEGGAWAGRR